MKRIIERMVVL